MRSVNHDNVQRAAHEAGRRPPVSPLPDWTRRHPRDVLREHGLAPQRALGQNFLIPAALMDRMADAGRLEPGDVALEIGTGLGHLAVRLAARAGHVVTVEVDAGLCRVAAANLADTPNVTLVHADFLESKHGINPEVTRVVHERLAGPGRLKVVSNLPYSISSPALVNLLEWELEPAELVLMLQREVAERVAAAPGTAEYGALTVFADYWATTERLFAVGKGSFWPPPQVSSVVLRLVRREGKRRGPAYERLEQTVRHLFTQRRKTLGRALASAWGAQAAGAALESAGLDGRARVEQLTTADLERLASALPPSAGG